MLHGCPLRPKDRPDAVTRVVHAQLHRHGPLQHRPDALPQPPGGLRLVVPDRREDLQHVGTRYLANQAVSDPWEGVALQACQPALRVPAVAPAGPFLLYHASRGLSEGRRILSPALLGDPLTEKRRADGIPTFADAAERVWKGKNPGWRHPGHAQDWMSSLRRHVRQRIGAVMEWAVAMELRTDNPCDRLGGVLGPQQDLVQHMRALPHGFRRFHRWKARGNTAAGGHVCAFQRPADPDLLRVRPAAHGDLADWRAQDG